MEEEQLLEEEIKDKSIFGQSRALTRIQYKKILKQQEKSLCQITTEIGKATGFLCKIPDPVLITNNHVLNETQLKPGKKIHIYFTDKNEIKQYKTITIMKQEIFTQLDN